MAIPTTRAEFKAYCLRKLGAPVIEINVDDDQVIGWVKAAMGPEQVAQYEKGALSELELLINPPIVVLPLPWSL